MPLDVALTLLVLSISLLLYLFIFSDGANFLVSVVSGGRRDTAVRIATAEHSAARLRRIEAKAGKADRLLNRLQQPRRFEGP
ncbi:MAG: hypothetical protein EA417_17700 [Gammaproteobacteria bacterium]|nr:MAG: hypothetical protein EA417_17700 [Gammaproteobacteria bacterium]